MVIFENLEAESRSYSQVLSKGAVGSWGYFQPAVVNEHNFHSLGTVDIS